MRRKLIFLVLAVLLVSIAQADQLEIPHQVYGEVNSSSDGSALQDVNVSFRNSSSFLVATQNTSSSGFYDLNLNGLDAGEDVYLFLDGSNTSEYVNFSQGSSTALDCPFNSSICVGDTGEGSDDDEDQDDNQTENPDTDDPDNGGSSDGSGGSGGGGGGGGGGFGGFPTDDEESDDSQVQSVGAGTSLDLNSSSYVRLEEVSAGTSVSVNISGESVLRGVNFDSEENRTTPVLRFNSSPVSPGIDGFEALEVFEVGLENISSTSSSSIGLEVEKVVLEEVDVSSGDLELRKYSGGSWSQVEMSVTSDLQSYLYEAEVDGLEGRYALVYPVEGESGGVAVQDLTAESDEGNVTVVARMESTGSEALTRSISLERSGEVVETWQVDLEPGETEELTYSTSLQPGTYVYSAGGLEVQVQVPDRQDSGFPFLLIIGAVMLLVLAIVLYVFVTEYRSAAELEETINEIEKKGDDIDKGIQNMREDIRRLRERVRSSEGR